MGDPFFFEITKAMHNALQGHKVQFTQAMFNHYREVNLENARRSTWEADFVLVHDPQPAYMITESAAPGQTLGLALSHRCVAAQPPGLEIFAGSGESV